MKSIKQLEKNTKESFQLARQDMNALYNHVERLHNVVLQLYASNQELKGQFLPQKVKIVASKSATKFHDSKCVFAKNIKSLNRITFINKNQALGKGLKACKCIS